MLQSKIRLKFTNNIILIILLVTAFTFFSLMSKDFISYFNISTMLKNMTISGIIALGLTPLMISRGVDISLGSNLSLTSVVVAILFRSGINIWLAVLIGLIMSTFIGFINGFFITRFDINPLMFTIGMMAILQSLAMVLSDNLSIPVFHEKLYWLVNANFFKIPFLFWIFMLIVFIYWVVLKYTGTGRRIYAIGGSPSISNLFGINVRRIKLLLYVFFGFTVGISTIIIMSLSSVGNPFHGVQIPLPIISSVVLGGVSFMSAGKGNIWGTFFGLLIITIVFNGMTQLNVPAIYLKTFQGLILIMVVGAYEIRDRNKKKYTG